jgi:CMP-N,N'-diacetyllegionaminic acid synthase
LQPTSPLRDEGDIDKAIRLFLRNKAESVVSVCEVEHPPHWHFKIENKYLKPIFGYKYLKMRRQDLLKSYTPNGAIYNYAKSSVKIQKFLF